MRVMRVVPAVRFAQGANNTPSDKKPPAGNAEKKPPETRDQRLKRKLEAIQRKHGIDPVALDAWEKQLERETE